MYYILVDLIVRFPMYLITTALLLIPCLLLASRLRLKYRNSEAFLVLVPFPLLWVAWLWFWSISGKGVYGYYNMLHQTIWAGVIGGSYGLARVIFYRHTLIGTAIGTLLVVIAPFVVAYFLYDVFPLGTD